MDNAGRRLLSMSGVPSAPRGPSCGPFRWPGLRGRVRNLFRSPGAGRGRRTGLVAAGAVFVLSGCQSHARQDVYTTPISNCAAMLPTVSGTRTYGPAGHDRGGQTGMVATLHGAPDSAVAYPDPKTPAFCDRPLSDTLPTSIEMADYVHLLTVTGRMALLQQNGPFTVFGIPNSALEAYSTRTGGLLAAAARSPRGMAAARALVDYSIVPGAWTGARIRAAVAADPAHRAVLPTLGGLPLFATVDPQSGQIVLENGQGIISRLWVMGVPQSNGVLYFTQSLLVPPVAGQAMQPRG